MSRNLRIICITLGLVLSFWAAAFIGKSFLADTIFNGPGLDGGVEILKPLLNNTGIENTSTLTRAILFWIKILLIIAGILAFVAFVWAGFLYITTFVSEENNEKAKKIMIFTGLGIIVILFSYILTNFFINATV